MANSSARHPKTSGIVETRQPRKSLTMTRKKNKWSKNPGFRWRCARYARLADVGSCHSPDVEKRRISFGCTGQCVRLDNAKSCEWVFVATSPNIVRPSWLKDCFCLVTHGIFCLRLSASWAPFLHSWHCTSASVLPQRLVSFSPPATTREKSAKEERRIGTGCPQFFALPLGPLRRGTNLLSMSQKAQ
jgi:hypothetical protein